MKFKFFFTILCLVVLTSQSNAIFHKVSEVQNYFFSSCVEQDNDLIFIGTCEPGSSPLFIVDVSDSENPNTIEELNSFSLVNNLQIKDSVALVSCENGLKLINYREPGDFSVSSFYSSGRVNDVRITNNYAAFAHQSGFQILDVTDSSTPVMLSNIITNAEVFQAEIVEDYVYIMTGNGIKVYDISEVTNPQLLGEYNSSFIVLDSFAVEGDYLYLADWVYLYKFDISNPDNVVLDATNTNFFALKNIRINDGLLHMANMLSGYSVYDVSDFENPQLVNSYDPPRESVDYAQNEEYLYVLDRTYGLQIVKKDYNDNPYEINRYFNEFQYTEDFDFDENYVYVADMLNGLTIYDRNNPEIPVFENSDEMGITTIYQDNNLFLSYRSGNSFSDGIKTYDVSNPEYPILVNDLVIENFLTQQMGDYLVFLSDDFEIMFYDFSDPENPEYVNQVHCTDWISDFKVLDGKLYLVYSDDFDSKIEIYDVSNIQNPQLLSELDLDIDIRNINVFEDVIYAGYFNLSWYGSISGFRIVDISDINNPSEVNDFIIFTPESPRNGGFGSVLCNKIGSTLIVADNRNNRLLFYNASDLINPEFIDDFNWNFHTDKICIDGENLLLNHRFNGITELNWDHFVDSDPNYIETAIAHLYISPNPFNPSGTGHSKSTKIQFQLPGKSIKTIKSVEIDIYNIKGQKVKTFLVPSSSLSQTNTVIWDGTDDNKCSVSCGIYLSTLRVDGNVLASGKMILMK